MSQVTWRLLLTEPMDGPMNMAIDQAIMEAVAEGRVPPTLRFFAWQPPSLSLGYTQPIADVNRVQLAARGWDLVRRMTGGRAILHTDELTYSVAVRADDPIVAGDIVESYRRLSQALVAGLRRLGADPQADRREDGHPMTKGPVCFEIPSHYEITVDGKKLIGSAQVRKFGAVLQHGSLPLYGDIARICDALVFEDENRREIARRRVLQRAATLESVLGRTISWDQAADAMRASFEDTFDLAFSADCPFTPEERARAEELRAQQYATDGWNARF
jgi:lipoate-protein ligase A